MNDINIVDCLETMGTTLRAEYPPRFDYCMSGVKRSHPYWLADGIYRLWAIFVKTVLGRSLADKEMLHAKLQESVRKDFECAFTVVLARFLY